MKYLAPPYAFKIVSFAFFLLIGFSLSAQVSKFEWIKPFSSATSDVSGVSIVVDSNKSIIVAGTFGTTTDFDGGPGTFNLTSNGRLDIFITKYDTAGTFLWAKQIGGVWDDGIKEIKLDKQGNLYILGYFQGTVDLDPGVNVVNFTTAYTSSFLLKLDSDGNFVWAKTFQLSGMDNLDIDASGNLIIGGSFAGPKDFDPGPATVTLTTASDTYQDLFILKLDDDGNFVWVRQMPNQGTSQHQHFGIRTDAENSIYFAGSFTASIDFDPGVAVFNLTSNGADDAFILKLDQQGNFQWAKHWGAAGSDKIFGLDVDRDGNVYTTGMYVNTVDFDPGPSTFTLSAPIRCCFISRLDKSGNFVFAKSLTGESWGQGIKLDSSSNIYVSGGFKFSVDFDPGPSAYTIPTGHLFTMKLFANGNFAWANGYITQPPGSFESVYSAIALDNFENVYYTGSFINTVDFDPGPSTYFLTSNGNWDSYILKTSQCHTVTSIAAPFCSSYTSNSVVYTNSGTYYQYFQRSSNCDSIVVLNLTKGDKSFAFNDTACNSYNWRGNVLTTSGIYKDTIRLVSGCDSIVQLNLTVNQSSRNSTSDVACGAYTWRNKVLTNSGTYSDTLLASTGCDSIIQLNLTVYALPRPSLGNDTSICTGGSLTLNPGNFNTYIWNNGSTTGSITVAAVGKYWVTVTNNNNCSVTDSITITPSGACAECSLANTKVYYPVPFNHWLTVDKNSTRCEVQLDLYNAIGQLIIKNKLVKDGQNRIYVHNLAAGNYLYLLHTNDTILKTGKLLIE